MMTKHDINYLIILKIFHAAFLLKSLIIKGFLLFVCVYIYADVCVYVCVYLCLYFVKPILINIFDLYRCYVALAYKKIATQNT